MPQICVYAGAFLADAPHPNVVIAFVPDTLHIRRKEPETWGDRRQLKPRSSQLAATWDRQVGFDARNDGVGVDVAALGLVLPGLLETSPHCQTNAKRIGAATTARPTRMRRTKIPVLARSPRGMASTSTPRLVFVDGTMNSGSYPFCAVSHPCAPVLSTGRARGFATCS